MNDVFTVAIPLPPSVQGMVATTPDGDYQIFINAGYSLEKQREIFDHEMRHILLGHYQQNERPIAIQECEADDKQLILDKIRQAQQQGLPLINGLLRSGGVKQVAPVAGAQPLPPASCAKDTLDDILGRLQTLEAQAEKLSEQRAEYAERWQGCAQYV